MTIQELAEVNRKERKRIDDAKDWQRVQRAARAELEEESSFDTMVDLDEQYDRRAMSLTDFIQVAEDIPAAIWGHKEEVLWASGQSLLIAASAGAGKTTIAGQLLGGILGLPRFSELFGYPIRPLAGNVLYLAMDRPVQAARSMARQFTPDEREAVSRRVVVWRGPYEAKGGIDALLELMRMAEAHTLFIDSAKDIVSKPSDDFAAGHFNRQIQAVVAEGYDVVILHHQRKADKTADGRRSDPTLDDVYGSVWFVNGAGSVLHLDQTGRLHEVPCPPAQVALHAHPVILGAPRSQHGPFGSRRLRIDT